MTTSAPFRRFVLALGQPMPGRATFDLATEIARAMQSELVGYYAGEEPVKALAGLPFARELWLGSREWHPIDAERLAKDLELTIRAAERTFSKAARAVGHSAMPRIHRGPNEEAIGSISTDDDVLVIGQPSAASERLVRTFHRRLEIALGTQSSVLVVPARLDVGGSTILGISDAQDEPAHSAAFLAQAMGGPFAAARSIEEFLTRHGGNPRLVVMERGSIEPDPANTAAMIADRRHVPLLILPPWLRAAEAARKVHITANADRS